VIARVWCEDVRWAPGEQSVSWSTARPAGSRSFSCLGSRVCVRCTESNGSSDDINFRFIIICRDEQTVHFQIGRQAAEELGLLVTAQTRQIWTG
jgi:hypothetical protein